MTLTDFISKVNYRLKGTDDDAPTVGDEDWLYWVSVANDKKNEMYDDTDKDWASAYSVESIGTILAASEPTFELDDTFISPADKAYVITTDDQYIYYTVIKPQERNRLVREVFVAGQLPQTLYFTNAIETGDQVVAGTLYLPGYWRPDDIDDADENADIPVDDPNWLVMATAAEIAANDITYEEKFDDINGKANVLYHNMTRKNRRAIRGSARVSQTQVKRITGFR